MGEAAQKRDQDSAPTANDNADDDPTEWLTSAEAAAKLKLKPAGLKALVFRGKIVPDHRGGRGGLRGHRFSIKTIHRYLRERGQL